MEPRTVPDSRQKGNTVNDTITELDLLESVRGAVSEMMEYRDSTELDDFEDDITEQADGLVNVWYTGAITEWYACNCPDAEMLGGEYPEHRPEDTTLMRVAREAQVAMYYWYHTEITRELTNRLNGEENN
jgi:hypothetical protein